VINSSLTVDLCGKGKSWESYVWGVFIPKTCYDQGLHQWSNHIEPIALLPELLSYLILIHPGWDIGPRRDQLADAWIDHGAWNDTIVQNYMHKDSVLIACIREPYAWFKSATKYFDHTRKFVSKHLCTPMPWKLYLNFYLPLIRGIYTRKYKWLTHVLNGVNRKIRTCRWIKIESLKHKNQLKLQCSVTSLDTLRRRGWLHNDYGFKIFCCLNGLVTGVGSFSLLLEMWKQTSIGLILHNTLQLIK